MVRKFLLGFLDIKSEFLRARFRIIHKKFPLKKGEAKGVVAERNSKNSTMKVVR